MSPQANGLKQDKHLNGKVCTVEKIEKNIIHVRFNDISGKVGSALDLINNNYT